MKLGIKIHDEILSYESDNEIINIGRSSDNDFVVPHEDFSRKHCQLTLRKDYIFIQDLGSKNGIILDGKRIKPHEQHAIYPNSKILLANFYEFLVPYDSKKKELTETNLNETKKPAGT